MMNKLILLIVMAFASVTVHADARTHWHYSGAEGPANWSRLSPEFSACTGKNQSPINLADFIEADLPQINFNYQAGGNEILNNGHTIQVNYQQGSTIAINGHTFTLKQFHFHAPSENYINGKQYPLEAHLVHADSEGNLAVIAIMFNEGPTNAALEVDWAKMPGQADSLQPLSPMVSAENIVPLNRDYYRFSGSLTTPPCTEGVLWMVMKNQDTASKAQIARFAKVIGEPDNRPLQATNARAVLQ